MSDNSPNEPNEPNGLEAALPALLMIAALVFLLVILIGSSGSSGDTESDSSADGLTATPTPVVLAESSTPRPATNTPTPIVLPGSQSTPAGDVSTTATDVAPTEASSPTVEPEEVTFTMTPVPEEPTTESTTHEGMDHETTSGEVGSVDGDPANGEALFTTFQPLAAFSCSNCHLVDSESMLIGPGLLRVSQHAQAHGTGLSVVEYLRQSIMDPNAYVVEGFTANLMPQVYAEIFTEQEINDIIAYLLTLEG